MRRIEFGRGGGATPPNEIDRHIWSRDRCGDIIEAITLISDAAAYLQILFARDVRTQDLHRGEAKWGAPFYALETGLSGEVG